MADLPAAPATGESGYESQGSVLIVFAKTPQPGMVKTRMTPPLSPDQAAELYTHMLDDVLEASAQFGAVLGLEVVLALHPPDACPAFSARVPRNVRVVAQQGLDLAERMSFAIMQAAASGAARILVRGSDSPVLDCATIESALAALDEADIAIAPDLDGGYGLIGVKAPAPMLFEHPMSTHTVLEETLESARRSGLRCSVLEPRFDLDSVADFRHLADARATGCAELCPRTLAYLDAHALWGDSDHAEQS